MEEERDWSQALTDEDLVAIDAAVESATTSLNNKRRSSSSSSPYVEIQNDAVESDAIIIRRRRLQRSLVSTSSSNPDVEIRNDAVESDPFRSRRADFRDPSWHSKTQIQFYLAVKLKR